MGKMPDPEEIVAAVTSSKKYRTICVDTVRRIAEQEMSRHDSLKAATKATKRRLHQVYGAFEQAFDDDTALQRLAAAYQAGSAAEVKAACRELLALHSSTRERLPILDRFYPALWAVTGRPASVLDLGCGLNPLALPWMDLPGDARYVALDIDAGRVAFLNRYLALAGLESLARCQDLLTHPPQDPADVALLLKTSPSLERQAPGATLHLLDQLQTTFVVVTYAVKSLAGREKGMVAHYRQQFHEHIAGHHWPIQELAFDTELAFVVNRKS
jgi:16S rRNA (guanine(1405)-N(7))-methyltransferase